MESHTFWVPKGSFQPLRYHPGGIGNWSGHLAFAHDLVAAYQPELLVELGTHYGESYFGFCQAVAENNIPCSCYAVDTWQGESHAGIYDESVFAEVSAYNTALYGRFSYLLRTTFDAAVTGFSDESIDVLHIDGLHTYDAVSRDFRTWLPKVKPGGVILLHDTSARHADFGVWRFWNELQTQGECFTFTHSWGLGVYRKPGSGGVQNPMLDALFNATSEYKEHIREFYSLCARRLAQQHYHRNRVRLHAQVFPYGINGYSADTAIDADLPSDDWYHLAMEIKPAAGNGPLRFDPIDQPGFIEISEIALKHIGDHQVVWSATPADIARLSTGGTLLSLGVNCDACQLLSFGSDPQVFLPSVPPGSSENPLLLEVRMRVQTQHAALVPILTHHKAERSADLAETVDTLTAERHVLVQERAGLRAERETVQQHIQQLASERDSFAQQLDSADAAYRKQQGELFVLRADIKRLSAQQQNLETQVRGREWEFGEAKARMQEELAETKARMHELQETIDGILASKSWRLTAPMRGLVERLRRRDR